MKYIFSLVLFLLSGHSWATIQCSANENRAANSLLSPGRSMENFRVQAQDGLGTCYANTLTAMLEAQLPGNPQLSYQQVAMVHGMWRSENGKSIRGRATYTVNNTSRAVSEFGNTCRAFDQVARATRGAGARRICRRQDVPIETTPMAYDQRTAIRSLGRFYDSVVNNPDRSVTGRILLANFKQDLKRAVHRARTLARSNCGTADPVAIRDRVHSYCLKQNAKAETLRLNLRIFQTMEGTPENQQIISNMQTELQGIESELASYAMVIPETGTDEFTCILNPSVYNEMNTTYWQHLKNGTGGDMRSRITEFSQRTNIPLKAFYRGSEQQLNEAYLRRLLRGDLQAAHPLTCEARLVWNKMRDLSFIRQQTNSRLNICLAQKAADAFKALDLSSSYQFPTQQMINLINNMDKGVEDFMMGAIGPGCLDNSVRIPNNFSCQTTCYPFANLSRESCKESRFTQPNWRNDEQLFHQARLRLRQEVNETIGTNRPLGVFVCTAYHREPSANTNFGYDCDTAGMHSLHMMTLVGQRCKDGVLQYQIQNSVGNSCNYYKPRGQPDADPQYECNNGAYWVDEDIILRNLRQTYRINT